MEKQMTFEQFKAMFAGKNQMGVVLAYNVLFLAGKPEYTCTINGQKVRVTK